jgi:hypothetical protein
MIRKITSGQDKKLKEERNKKIMVIVLGIILLFSSAGYFANDMFGNKAQTINYEGIKFTQTDYGSWKAEVQGLAIETKYNPNQTKEVLNKAGKTLADYSNKPLYFAAEPEFSSQESNYELVSILTNFVARIDNACMNDNCSLDYAKKDCLKDNVILFMPSSSNITEIVSKDNCVYIKYAPGEAILGADAFLFRLIGLQ